MTAKQERFCQEYVKCGNAAEAAKKAGYSARTAKSIGQQNLTKLDLKERIQALQAEIKNENIMDAREMQEHLTSIIRQISEEEVVVVEGQGEGVSEARTVTKKSSHADRIRAIQLLAKMQGVLESGNTINVAVPIFAGEEKLED